VPERLTIGTRRSRLALAQTGLVVRALARRSPGIDFRVLPMSTSGDRDRRPGTSPDFTDAIDRALREGDVDLAVHSAKDLPAEPVPGIVLAACPRRGDARDCLVVGRRWTRGLPKGARIGSSSLRRRAQLLRWRPDLEVVELRGNVDHRLRRVQDGELDAVIVAAAGVRRLGLAARIGRLLPTREFLPAPAQGALAVLAREDDRRANEVAARIDAPATSAAVRAERAFAAALGGDCRLPLAALARAEGARLALEGEVLSVDGRVRFRSRGTGSARKPEPIGRHAAERLLAAGAGAVLGRG
jgi:hydroxymethylbilane synthase